MLPLLADQAAAAQRALPAEVWGYLAGGAQDEVSVAEATAAWQAVRLRPRVLRDVSAVSTALTLLGTTLRTPVLVGPTASHGRLHPEGEAATARGTGEAGSLLVLSSRSSTPVAELACEGPWWWQAYVLRDRAATLELALGARAAGAGAVVVTGDTPYLGSARRPALGELEQDPAATLDVIAWLAAETDLPVLVKGVLRGDDAQACLEAGAAGVVVSNHGGRQLDRAVSTAAALPEVVAAVAGRAPVLVDGGLRSGLDVLCALALGADAVLLGRPVMWALAAGGAEGVASCLSAITEQLAHVMGLAGCPSLAEVRSLS
ncbi:MAG: Hydroxyacid oxidase 1 [Frankiales bacterium]|nr:Hydroxyacid oxidase 1 [Frankiales bacterium]